MSTWESVGSTYVESVTSTLPFHRLVLFVVGFIGSVAIGSQTHLSITETIANLKLSDLTGLDTQLLRVASVSDVWSGVFAIIFGWFVFRVLTWAMFELAAKASKLSDRSKQAIHDARRIVTLTLEEKVQELSILEASIEKTRIRLKAMNAFGEIFGGMAVCGFIATTWGNVLDFCVGAVCFFACIVTCVTSIRTFFLEYYGPALFISQLQGRKLPELP